MAKSVVRFVLWAEDTNLPLVGKRRALRRAMHLWRKRMDVPTAKFVAPYVTPNRKRPRRARYYRFESRR